MNFCTRVWGTALAAVIISTAVGCSSSGGGKSGAFTTSVPPGTKLTALTPSQATQLCNDLNTYAQGTLTSLLCKQLGVEAALFLEAFQSTATDAQLQMTCQAAYDDCLHPDGGVAAKTPDAAATRAPSATSRPPAKPPSATCRPA